MRRRIGRAGVVAGVVVMTLLALACEDEQKVVPARRGVKGESCLARNDCQSGLMCVQNMCVIDEFPIKHEAKVCDVIECEQPADCVRIAGSCSDYQEACTGGSEAACEGFDRWCTFQCEEARCLWQCKEDEHCAGEKCVDGRCVTCRGDADCDDGERCDDGDCVEPCQDDGDCPVFHRCGEGGRCAESGCSTDRECVAATRNVEARCEDKQCIVPCVSDAECDDPTDFDFMACDDGVCRYVGCTSDTECRAAVAWGGLPEGVSVVCHAGDEPRLSVDLPDGPPGDVPGQCQADQFRCGDGECIPASYRCDGGTPDCDDGSDEANCGGDACEGDEFTCANGNCIPGSWRCDGTADCGDGSDEAGCPT